MKVCLTEKKEKTKKVKKRETVKSNLKIKKTQTKFFFKKANI